MVLYGRIILWHKWLVLWVWRQIIVLFCPHFWRSRIGLGVQLEMGRSRSRQGVFFFGRPWNTVAPSAIYFSVLVITERSKLLSAPGAASPASPAAFKCTNPVSAWRGLAGPSPGILARGGDRHKPDAYGPYGCHPLKLCGTTGSHLHWCVVHKALINCKSHCSQQPADDAGGFMSSVNGSLCCGREGLNASERTCGD